MLPFRQSSQIYFCSKFLKTSVAVKVDEAIDATFSRGTQKVSVCDDDSRVVKTASLNIS